MDFVFQSHSYLIDIFIFIFRAKKTNIIDINMAGSNEVNLNESKVTTFLVFLVFWLLFFLALFDSSIVYLFLEVIFYFFFMCL